MTCRLGLNLPLLFAARFGIRGGKIIRTVVARYFQQALFSAVDILEFDGEHGINPILARQQMKPVLPAISGKEGILRRGRLAVKLNSVVHHPVTP
jgi:hypothetical protein